MQSDVCPGCCLCSFPLFLPLSLLLSLSRSPALSASNSCGSHFFPLPFSAERSGNNLYFFLSRSPKAGRKVSSRRYVEGKWSSIFLTRRKNVHLNFHFATSTPNFGVFTGPKLAFFFFSFFGFLLIEGEAMCEEGKERDED